MNTKKTFPMPRIRRSFLAIFSLALSLGMLLPQSSQKKANAAMDAVLIFDQSSVFGRVDDQINLIARVDPGTNNVGAVRLDVKFDPTVLRLDSITKSSAFALTLYSADIDNVAGTGSIEVGVDLFADPVPYITEFSDVATYSFTALSDAVDSAVYFENTSEVSAEGAYVTNTRVGSLVTIDSIAPTVTDFSIPATSETLEVTISSFTASDAVGVEGYMVTESSSAPAVEAAGWTSSAPASYTFSSAGNKTLYAWAKDEIGNVSTSVSDSVSITLPDTAAPVISGGSPSGTLSFGTTEATLSVTTNENATCNYALSAGTDFDAMTLAFDTTGGTTHTKMLTGLTSATSYSYYVRCSDGDLNKNQTDYQVSFAVDDEPVVEENPDPQDIPAKVDIPKPKVKLDDEKKTLLSYFKDNKKIKFYSQVEAIAEGEVKIHKDGKLSEEVPIDEQGNWEAKLKFKDSTQVKLYFYDKDGTEVGTKKYRIRIDSEDPEFTDLPLSLRKKPGDKLWWKATDNKKIDYYKYEIAGKERKTDDDFFFIPKDISKGPHAVKISAYDKAGNKTTKTTMVIVW